MPGTPFFTWPRPYVRAFLGDGGRNLVFIPYAAVTLSVDEYARLVTEVFATMGFHITSVHQAQDPRQALQEADGVVVGGGNSFVLLHRMLTSGLLPLIRERVLAGMPYLGWSAGANLACPTIMTTNDMPIVQLPSLEALSLVPFQINPHYHELKFEGQGGETRRERLEEFIAFNPTRQVLGLPEGMLVQVADGQYTLHGQGVAKWYSHGKPLAALQPGEQLMIW